MGRFCQQSPSFAAILYFLSRKQGLDAFVDVLRRTGAVSFCVAVVLMLLVQGISAYRVKIITAAEALHSTGYRSLVRIQLISQFIAYGAPISALSDLAKAAMIKLRFDLPLGQSVRIVLYESICGALGAIVIGLLTTIWQLAIDTPRPLVDIQFAVWAVGLMVGATILVIGELNLTSRNQRARSDRARPPLDWPPFCVIERWGLNSFWSPCSSS